MPGCEKALHAIRSYLTRLETDPALERAHLSGTGPVRELEEKLRSHYGMRYALATSNATTALLATALALDLREVEFVTTPLTYGGSLSAWLLLGNQPVFADIDPDTLTLDPRSVRRRITRKTRAILAVDLFGVPCDTKAMRELADELGMVYVADAAQSLGARIDDIPAGGAAHVVVTSFTAGKPLFAGEGGALVTDLERVYKNAVLWTQHPYRQKRELGLEADNEFSFNGRPHPLGVLWANTLFKEALQELERQRQEWFRLLEAAEATGLVEVVSPRWRARKILPAFRRLVARWKTRPDPDRLVQALAREEFHVDIEPSPVRLLYRQPAFRKLYGHLLPLQRIPCPVAERVADHLFSIQRRGGGTLPAVRQSLKHLPDLDTFGADGGAEIRGDCGTRRDAARQRGKSRRSASAAGSRSGPSS